MRGSLLVESILVLLLVTLFWQGANELGFASLCRKLSSRLESLQETRERYDGSHP